jgi:hypothetical protein
MDKDFISARELDEALVLELVARIRRELPGLGVRKLHWMLCQPLKTNGVKMGRDKQRVQKLAFPEGMYYSKKTDQVRPPRVKS